MFSSAPPQVKYNIIANYTTDYTTNNMQSFIPVFAILFNGCTGIMAGANMSGFLIHHHQTYKKNETMIINFS